MDVLDIYAKISIDTKDYEKGLDGASNNAKSFGGKLKSGLATAAKVGAAALTTVTTAAVAFSTAMIKGIANTASYGDNIDKMSQKMGISAEAYQEWDAVMQHSGTSMETLKASMKTLANAAQTGSDAFDKLGISQKEIASMSQEELFGATITALQNVENETERTYLAGKTLGKGATELGALLNTSAEETQAMKDRVHELGGVMSDEAVKAAAKYQDTLQDMQTAFSGLKNNLMSDFLPSVTAVMDGLTSIFSGDSSSGIAKISEGIGSIVDKIVTALPEALSGISTIITSIVTTVADNLPTILTTVLPTLLENGGQLLQAITEGLIQALPTLAEAAIGLVTMLSEYLAENAGSLIEAALNMILTLANGLIEALPTILPQIVGIVMDIAAKLTEPETLTSLVTAAIDLILALANGLIESIPVLLERLPEIVTNIVMGLIEAAPLLVEGAIELIMALVGFLTDPNTLWLLIKAVPEIVIGIVKGLIEAAPKMIKSGIELLKKLWDGIQERFGKLSEDIKTIPGKIVGWLKEKFGEITSAGKDLVKGLWKGIKAMGNWIKEKVGGFFGGILDGIKGLFGIHSPSKVFAGIGRNLVEGFSLGFDQEFGKTKNDIISQMDELTDIEPRFSVYGSANGYELEGVGNVNIVQNIYSEVKTAADLQQEAVWYAKRGFLTGV